MFLWINAIFLVLCFTAILKSCSNRRLKNVWIFGGFEREKRQKFMLNLSINVRTKLVLLYSWDLSLVMQDIINNQMTPLSLLQ